jgi:probable rRNA maturation factor
LLIVNQTKFKLKHIWLKKTIQQIWLVLGLDSTKTIDLVLVEPDEIKKLNQQYRQQDQVTDILSFGYKEDGSWPEKIKCDNIFGELVICLTQIKKQAMEQKIPWQTELTLILIHGILHLMGLDHKDATSLKVMQIKAREIYSLVQKSKIKMQNVNS